MASPADLLRQLSERGRPRGAPDVFAGAAARASARPRALVAAAVVLAVVAAVGIVTAGDEGAGTVAAPGRAEVTGDPSAPSIPSPGGDDRPATDQTDDRGDRDDDVDDGSVASLGDSPPVTTRLESHSSCSSVLGRLRALGSEAVGPRGFDNHSAPVGAPGTAAPAAGGGDVADGGTTAGADPAHSRSNVQESGVDEADLVKTDGDVLVAVARGRLQVVSAADRTLLASMELPVRPSGLFFHDSTVTVIGSPVWDDHDPGVETPVTVIDLRDPAAPTERSTTWVEGLVRSSRLQSGVVRLVMGDAPRFVWSTPSDDSDAAARQAEAENRRLVESSTLTTWLPEYRTVDVDGRVVDAGLATSCASTYTPSEQSGFDTTTVVTLDPATGALDPGTGIAATPVVVYASEASLYVVSSACCPASFAELRSDIHRFDLSSPTAAPYRSSGSVPGFPVDQFALSERDGHLRIATTYGTGDDQSSRGEADTDSAVWVLAERGGALDLVGSLDGLGEQGERIHSVRYHDRYAYVVTFRRTDPLYIVDLTDPVAPTLLGELHVPGFSTFLQHVGDGRLVGVGRDADEDGRVQGLQLSLFDVSDASAPARADVLTYERGSSSAEHDHLALLHWEPEDLVVVPLVEFPAGDRCEAFAGVAMIRLEGAAFSEVARVSHADHATTDDDTAAVVPIHRSAVAASSLLTISELGVAFGDLRTGDEQHFVTFDGPESGVERFGCRTQQPPPPPEDDSGSPLPF